MRSNDILDNDIAFIFTHYQEFSLSNKYVTVSKFPTAILN